MRKNILLLLCVLVSVTGVAFAGTSEVQVLVVPGGITTTLTASPTFYSFGTVNVGVSTNSQTTISLTNNGTVGVTLEKKLTTAEGGTVVLVTAAPVAINEFRLRCVVSATKAALGTGYDNATTDFLGSAAYNPLTFNSGAAATLNPSAACNTWYQIDMPPAVDNQSQRRFNLMFEATAQ